MSFREPIWQKFQEQWNTVKIKCIIGLTKVEKKLSIVKASRENQTNAKTLVESGNRQLCNRSLSLSFFASSITRGSLSFAVKSFHSYSSYLGTATRRNNASSCLCCYLTFIFAGKIQPGGRPDSIVTAKVIRNQSISRWYHFSTLNFAISIYFWVIEVKAKKLSTAILIKDLSMLK